MASSKVNIDVWMRNASSEKFRQCDPTGVRRLEHKEKLKCDIIMPSLFVDANLRNEQIEEKYKEFTINKILKQCKDNVNKEEYKKDLENILCVTVVYDVRGCLDSVIKLKD